MAIKKNYKKSQGHVEFIISFVIFVGFVFFLLIFINPLRDNRASNTLIDDTWSKLLNNLSIDYDYVSLIISNMGQGKNSKSCFSINMSSFNMNPTNILVTDSINNYRNVTNDSNGFIVINKTAGESFYKFYQSPYFNKHTYTATRSNCDDLAKKADYSFGLLNHQSSILYENFDLLNQTYYRNYQGLKNNLSIDGNFEFIIYNETGSKLFEAINDKLVKTANVLSRNIPLTVINEDAKQIKIVFNLRVWK